MGALPRFYYIDITLILFFHKTYFRSDLLEICFTVCSIFLLKISLPDGFLSFFYFLSNKYDIF